MCQVYFKTQSFSLKSDEPPNTAIALGVIFKFQAKKVYLGLGNGHSVGGGVSEGQYWGVGRLTAGRGGTEGWY